MCKCSYSCQYYRSGYLFLTSISKWKYPSLERSRVEHTQVSNSTGDKYSLTNLCIVILSDSLIAAEELDDIFSFESCKLSYRPLPCTVTAFFLSSLMQDKREEFFLQRFILGSELDSIEKNWPLLVRADTSISQNQKN